MTAISTKPDNKPGTEAARTGAACNNGLTALFAGSFDPFTIGHKDVVDRALALFGRVVICIGINAAKNASGSHSADTAAHRRRIIADIFADQPRVSVITSSRLTVEAARSVGADVLLRAVRSVRDFEYERDMADLNRRLSGIETVFLMASPELAAISSSAVRDIAAHGADISDFIPLRNTHSQPTLPTKPDNK